MSAPWTGLVVTNDVTEDGWHDRLDAHNDISRQRDRYPCLPYIYLLYACLQTDLISTVVLTKIEELSSIIFEYSEQRRTVSKAES